MKIIFISLLMLMLGLAIGSLYGDRLSGVFIGSDTGMGSMESSKAEPVPLYWVAPMDKNYRRDKPGFSPMGMDLVPVYGNNSEGEEGSVKISAVVFNNLGVRTAPVELGPIDLSINTVGYVSFDEEQLSHIHSRVDGWIEVLNVTSAGDMVKKGQTLYELYSPALVNAQEEYLSALRSGNKILIKASVSRLQSLGFSKSQVKRLTSRRKVSQRVKVLADRSGFVKDLNVRLGMFIKPSTDVMSIGSLKTVWVIAEVFERQAHWVKNGQEVSMSVGALPGRVWKGKVDYLYPVLDSKTRTLRVRVRVENGDFALKPNMYADVSLMANVSASALSVPRESLIKAGKHTRVVKVLSEHQYKSVLVTPGVETGGRVQILAGLSEGDRVVTSAQFLIDSESNIDAELARMEERNGEMSDMSRNQTEAKVKRVEAWGKINQVITVMGILDVTHDAIPELDWPQMKMMFPLSDSIDIASLKAGQDIRFTLAVSEDNEFLIEALSVLSKTESSHHITSQ